MHVQQVLLLIAAHLQPRKHLLNMFLMVIIEGPCELQVQISNHSTLEENMISRKIEQLSNNQSCNKVDKGTVGGPEMPALIARILEDI